MDTQGKSVNNKGKGRDTGLVENETGRGFGCTHRRAGGHVREACREEVLVESETGRGFGDLHRRAGELG